MTQEKVGELLKSINYPGFSRDIVSFGIVKGIQVSENQITVNLAIATQNQEHINSIKNDVERVLSSETGIADIQVNFLQASDVHRTVLFTVNHSASDGTEYTVFKR